MIEGERRSTLGQKIETAFWAPKATKSEAPHETLLTILLQPAPMKTLSTSTLPLDMASVHTNICVYRERR